MSFGDPLHDPLTGEYRLDRRLEQNAHPVTAVTVDEATGIIILERYNADPEPVSPGSPLNSRREMLHRCEALLAAVERKLERAADPSFVRLEYKLPVSELGIGLTYDELRVQVYMAVLKSRDIERRLVEKANRKYGL